MRLVSVKVTNYRSITKAHKLPVSSSTILIGPNNEGKSNILRATVAALQVLARPDLATRAATAPGVARLRRRDIYDWEQDFPLSKQERDPKGASLVLLEFELSPTEVRSFAKKIGSTLNGTLPIEIAFSATAVTIKVRKQGPGSKTLNRKSRQIAEFITDRLDFEHIPAVRTAQEAVRIAEQMAFRALSAVESNPDYKRALADIRRLQEPILKSLSKTIEGTLKQFLPAVQSVQVRVPQDVRARALRHCDIIIDDGTPTDLHSKGDGVQSLAAIALMRHASEVKARGRTLIIALEEPESHLHPEAIHELHAVLLDLSREHQILLSSHCPLFVDRTEIDSNIIVNKGVARPARTVAEIRDVLGVRASDNLRHARVALLTEGSNNVEALQALISSSSKIDTSLKDGLLVIRDVGGAGNLSYCAGTYRDSLCRVLAFLDDDAAARSAADVAIEDRALDEADVVFSSCADKQEAEFEDLVSPDLYLSALAQDIGIGISRRDLKGAKKWSARMAVVVRKKGRRWTAQTEARAKRVVAETVASSRLDAIPKDRRGPLETLIARLEQSLK